MSDHPAPKPAPKHEPKPAQKHPENSTEVYAIHGAEPEVLAYAMAKYSRSALTMRESLAEDVYKRQGLEWTRTMRSKMPRGFCVG